MDLNENKSDLGSGTSPNHTHNRAISRATHAHRGTETGALLRGIDASTYDVQRRTELNIAYQIRIAKGRAETAYQLLQLR